MSDHLISRSWPRNATDFNEYLKNIQKVIKKSLIRNMRKIKKMKIFLRTFEEQALFVLNDNETYRCHI